MSDPNNPTVQDEEGDNLIIPAGPEEFPFAPEVRYIEPGVYKVPAGFARPVAEHYSPLNWGNGFERWCLVRFTTPSDGHCLFHAIANGFFEPYHTGKIRDQPVTPLQIVTKLRAELADKLSQPDTGNKNGKTFYQNLQRGNIESFARAVPEFSLDNMKKSLNSDTSIGYGYMEFIANSIGKDIYVLDANHRDLYQSDETALAIHGNRPSVVLIFINNDHYELVGIVNSEGTFDTHFPPDHSLIQFLRSRIA